MNKFTLFNKKEVDSITESQKYLVIAKELQLDSCKRFYLRIISGMPVDVNIVNAGQLKLEQPPYFQEVEEKVYDKYIAIINNQSKSNVRSILGV